MNYLAIIPIALAGSLALAAYTYSRAAYESAEYTVVATDGDFEIRTYPDLLLVSTSMSSPSSRDQSGFRRLLRYITGANEADQKIAMTTPVFTTKEGRGRRMSFVVPRSVAASGAPRARRADVELESMPAGRFAVHRFTGRWAPDDFAKEEGLLIEWTRRQGLEPVGPVAAAGYDPPFVPPFLRRNEVLVRLAYEPGPPELPPSTTHGLALDSKEQK